MSIKKIQLPKYTLAQEISNAITHGVGAIFGIIILILMLLKINLWGYQGSSDTDLIYRNIGVILYASGMIICYTISCIYHSLAKNKGKKVLRVIDHDMVYLLIGGTYSVYCLVPLRDVTIWNTLPYAGFFVFVLCWIGVIIGIVFNSIDIKKYAILSYILYILIGWLIIICFKELINSISLAGTLYLLFGGIAYTIGAILYGIGAKKSLWFHTVFHCFILLGTILQFISIWFYVLN